MGSLKKICYQERYWKWRGLWYVQRLENWRTWVVARSQKDLVAKTQLGFKVTKHEVNSGFSFIKKSFQMFTETLFNIDIITSIETRLSQSQILTLFDIALEWFCDLGLGHYAPSCFFNFEATKSQKLNLGTFLELKST